MNSTRVLVTGATGFTGGHLCERLIREGYSVRGLVRNPARAAHLHRRGVEIAVGDLRDAKSLRSATRKISVVYHIAAEFRRENLPRKEMMDINVNGTKNMLDAAIQSGVERFVHCSTVGVHGHIENPPANEETRYAPGDSYQESKLAAERIVLQYRGEGRLPIVIFRPGGIYGPQDLRFLKLFRAIGKKRFVMLGSGKVIYQMIYIDDLIDGVLLCGRQANATGNIYILTGEEPTTLNQLVQVIAEVLGVSPTRLHFPVTPVYLAGFACELLCKPLGFEPPLYRRRVDFFRKNRCFDVSKAKKELGFDPKTNLKTGIRLTAEWYRNEGLL